MLKTLTLLLPALIPSWRFFDVIAPSPRIEFARLKMPGDMEAVWQEFRPRPAHVPLRAMTLRMVWNPVWNQSLFLVNCAENLMESGRVHYYQEILSRITAEIKPISGERVAASYLQFRLVFISRQDDALVKDIMFVSECHHIGNAAEGDIGERAHEP